MGQIMLISDYLSFNITLCILFFFDLIHFKDLGQKLKNIFLQFLVKMKTSKFAFEIICPLETVKWNFVVSLKNLKFIELLSYLHKQTLNCIFESAHTFRSLNSTISISLLY